MNKGEDEKENWSMLIAVIIIIFNRQKLRVLIKKDN